LGVKSEIRDDRSETGKSMEPKEDAPTSTNPRVWTLSLLAVHLLVGAAVGAFVRLGGYDEGRTPPTVIFAGLIFAQGSLLGIWASLGMNPWWGRLAGLLIGCVCLGVGAGIGLDELDESIFYPFALPGIMVATVLTIFRCFKYCIDFPTNEHDANANLQFGIRHLLIMTVVVAVILAIGRSLKLSLPDNHLFVLTVVIASAQALVGVLSPWAMLRERLLVVRGAILLAVAAVAGWGTARILTQPSAAFWISIALTEATVLIASLLVVRRCGYRLMRVPRGQSTSEVGYR